MFYFKLTIRVVSSNHVLIRLNSIVIKPIYNNEILINEFKKRSWFKLHQRLKVKNKLTSSVLLRVTVVNRFYNYGI